MTFCGELSGAGPAHPISYPVPASTCSHYPPLPSPARVNGASLHLTKLSRLPARGNHHVPSPTLTWQVARYSADTSNYWPQIRARDLSFQTDDIEPPHKVPALHAFNTSVQDGHSSHESCTYASRFSSCRGCSVKVVGEKLHVGVVDRTDSFRVRSHSM